MKCNVNYLNNYPPLRSSMKLKLQKKGSNSEWKKSQMKMSEIKAGSHHLNQYKIPADAYQTTHIVGEWQVWYVWMKLMWSAFSINTFPVTCICMNVVTQLCQVHLPLS